MLLFRRFCLGVIVCSCLASPSLFAQQQQASQAVQAQQQAGLPQQVQGGVIRSSMTSAETFAPASPADSDIGEQVLLQPVEKYQPFSAWTNWSVFWTNNAQLLENSNSADTVLTGTVGGSYLPHLGNNLFADFSAEQSLFRYATDGSLDFNSLQLKAGLIYVIRQLDDLTLFTHYTYDLLTARGLNRQIYADQMLSVGARKVFAISRAQLFYTSISADFTLGGEPNYALHNEFSWLAGYQLSLTRNVKLDLYYRAAAQDYRYVNRADFNQLIGGGVTLEITRWLSVQAVTTMAINRSTDGTFNYFAANLGGGIGLMVNF
ncbi:MAG: hypothetical protein PHC88_05910 [Terrimicrobiaceae bacterium]|nr:hypothetical protein [Terrimicrobiaceae bacterium]